MTRREVESDLGMANKINNTWQNYDSKKRASKETQIKRERFLLYM